MLELLDTPGCSARRNCTVNLDDLRWDCPHVDCEPQQVRVIPRNLQLDETICLFCPVRVKVCDVQVNLAIELASVQLKVASRCQVSPARQLTL
jgi:hypothetical protein